MLRKPQFFNLIRQGDFKELFVSELGWNRYRGYAQLPPILVDEKEYNITAIAERSGFQVLYSEVDEIPTQRIAKKIDTKLRRQALDYICIYRLRDTAHDLWVVPVRTNEKRDLVLVEYDNANAEVLYQKIDGITFELDEETNIVDLRSKVQTAFAVNSEKITKDFYAGFKKEHKAFVEFIKGIEGTETAVKDRQWYASVMLNRLMFCYFIQKKGFFNDDKEYLKKKLEWVQHERGEGHFFRSFYIGFLRGLFHDGLNTPRHDKEFEKIYGRIPYLNGGMFDEHQIEHDYAGIDIADAAFERLFSFFDKWEWHLDTRLTASGRDINPDVLGYIFEQYINDRAQMGAYYTKEDITEYIGRNCILPYLFDQVKDATADSAKAFAPDGYVWRTLRDSGDRYIFDAVKKGYPDFGQIPGNIARGIITEEMRKEYSETPVSELPDNHIPLAELRSDWNSRTPEPWGLPNEIWRETIDRLQRCADILGKINRGEITSINDFITYNLDIRTFAADLIAHGDSRFVGWLYHALQRVTILDPTCGSGAFLFAAMNILEPLYEISIDRMQEFNRENPVMFKAELAEITDKYRSNIQYFIFKSIILRNLYGVDIMVEATEIAKLRLFLKMVAVVDVDRRADNLGLDPLPDIDFNIRCGNTLVGYANKAQLEHDLGHAEDILQELANQDFKQQIEDEVQKMAAAYRIFIYQQLRQEEDIVTFKRAKKDLRTLQKSLNDKLNHRLYLAASPDMNYEDWLLTHQPFNWFSEFYEIIDGNKGFDVIIGNPPYIEYSKVSKIYHLDNYKSIKCGNIYAQVLERCDNLININGKLGWIVPISVSCTERTSSIQSFINLTYSCHSSSFDIFPSKLFDGAAQRVTILILSKGKQLFTTKYHRWNAEERKNLFKLIIYSKNLYYSDAWTPRIQQKESKSIIGKMINLKPLLNHLYDGTSIIYIHRIINNFIKALDFEPYCKRANGQILKSDDFKTLNVAEKNLYVISAILNSSLFYAYWRMHGDGFHCGFNNIEKMKIPDSIFINEMEELNSLTKLMINDFNKNSLVKIRNQVSTGEVKLQTFYIGKSKSLINQIDTILARHYGFTDEELDFIINYDIKYRMGDELSNE